VNVLRWFRSGESQKNSDERSEPVEQSCPGIARVLGRIFESGKQPEVLDLGQLSGSAAIYLADRGARVFVESFEPPEVEVDPEDGGEGEPVEKPALTIAQPDGKFDLVLMWEHGDFVPPERLGELMSEVRRVTAPGGFVVLFSQDRMSKEGAETDRPSSFRLEADDRILRTPRSGPPRPRWAYANRAIEQALLPLSVQGIHLHGNHMREVVARKPAR
jgi:SAM-dependent methyltransferase